MRRILVGSICLLLLPSTLFAQRSAPSGYPKYELSIAGGGTASTEDDIFNVSPDSKSKPDFIFGVSGRQNFNQRFGLGIHFYGAGEETPEYSVSSPTFTGVTKFDLVTANLGVDGRYTFSRGTLQPYAWLGLNYVGGSADSDQLGTLDITGISVGGGPGVSFLLSPNFALGLEGLFSFGAASWENKPFQNSTSDDFDPSLFGLVGHITFLWRYQ